ncbi:hypothetical protein [Amycolatopsis sp. lyj-23]|uniref:hypothetical protein n=1 Tax=Amycolatopsis sp. lyj-23 TaxID=2789283 RepID=UPI00397AC4E9
MSAPTATPAAPQPYPDDADEKIRKIAELLGRDGIIRLLDDVRNKLLGNAFQLQDMAMEFAKNHTLADAADDIDNAVQAVAGTWTGRAAAQFTTYAGNVGKALGDQQDVVGSMSGILSGIAGCVIETYSKSIEFIGTCAVELGKLGYKMIVAIATAEIPIVDIFTSKEVIDAVMDAFANLVTSINGLFAQAVSTLGDFRAQATALVQGDTDFPDLPPMPANSGMDNEKQWRVDPTAAPA